MAARSTKWGRGQRYALLGLPLILGGCDSDQVRVCETQLKEKLKSPASYKRVSVDSIQIDSSIHKPPYDEVTITYDAANSYNALLRDKETCFYQPGTSNLIDNPFEKEAEAEAQKMADAALNAAANGVDESGNAVENASDAIDETSSSPDTAPIGEDTVDNYDVNNDAGE